MYGMDRCPPGRTDRHTQQQNRESREVRIPLRQRIPDGDVAAVSRLSVRRIDLSGRCSGRSGACRGRNRCGSRRGGGRCGILLCWRRSVDCIARFLRHGGWCRLLRRSGDATHHVLRLCALCRRCHDIDNTRDQPDRQRRDDHFHVFNGALERCFALRVPVAGGSLRFDVTHCMCPFPEFL